MFCHLEPREKQLRWRTAETMPWYWLQSKHWGILLSDRDMSGAYTTRWLQGIQECKLSEPVSSVPPWLLLQFLSPGFCFEFLPWLPPVILCDVTVVKQNKPFPPQITFGHGVSLQQKTLTQKLVPGPWTMADRLDHAVLGTIAEGHWHLKLGKPLNAQNLTGCCGRLGNGDVVEMQTNEAWLVTFLEETRSGPFVRYFVMRRCGFSSAGAEKLAVTNKIPASLA